MQQIIAASPTADPPALRMPLCFTAEGKGLEPSTPCGATDFESVSSPFGYPPDMVLCTLSAAPRQVRRSTSQTASGFHHLEHCFLDGHERAPSVQTLGSASELCHFDGGCERRIAQRGIGRHEQQQIQLKALPWLQREAAATLDTRDL